MTTISAKIVADSISPQGKRLTTMELRYPRFVHAESKTHRLHSETGEFVEELLSQGLMSDPNLSRNARSSRAVPVPKMIQEAMNDPVIPIHWGAAQRGMQAYEQCDNTIKMHLTGVVNEQELGREEAWLEARDAAVSFAKAFHDAGYAKQVINRLLEPFLHIDTLVTATEWSNWDVLRDHHMAEPHIEALAKAMKKARAESTPDLLQPGEWHLPYVTNEQDASNVIHFLTSDGQGGTLDFTPSESLIQNIYRRLSVARCARISYAPFDGDASVEAELKRYDLLVGSAPLHASPAEHQATPDKLFSDKAMVPEYRHPELHGNLKGWCQYRKFLAGECVTA